MNYGIERLKDRIMFLSYLVTVVIPYVVILNYVVIWLGFESNLTLNLILAFFFTIIEVFYGFIRLDTDDVDMEKTITTLDEIKNHIKSYKIRIIIITGYLINLLIFYALLTLNNVATEAEILLSIILIIYILETVFLLFIKILKLK